MLYKVEDSNALIYLEEEEKISSDLCLLCGEATGIKIKLYNEKTSICIHNDCLGELTKRIRDYKNGNISSDIPYNKIRLCEGYSNSNCPICLEKMRSGEKVKLGNIGLLSDYIGLCVHINCLEKLDDYIEEKSQDINNRAVISSL